MYDSNPIFTIGVPNPPVSEKKSRKKWVILAITVFTVTGIIVVAIIFSPKPFAPTWADAHEAFNVYSNYLLFGEKSEENPKDQYYRTDIYKMERIVYDSPHEEIVAYYNEVQKLFDIFLEKYTFIKQKQSSSDFVGNIEHLNIIVDAHRSLLDFFHKTSIVSDIGDRDVITEKYLANGEASVMEYVKSNEASYDDDEGAQMYASLKLEQVTSLLAILNIYKNSGCIKDGRLLGDDACRLSQVSQDIVQENMSRFISARDGSKYIVDAKRDELLLRC